MLRYAIAMWRNARPSGVQVSYVERVLLDELQPLRVLGSDLENLPSYIA